jgi:hypothetical protein
VPLDLAGRHPAGIEGEDLLVETVEGARMLGHDPRLERGVAVAWQLDRDGPLDRAQRLLRAAVAPVRLPIRRLRGRLMLSARFSRDLLPRPPRSRRLSPLSK